MKEVTITENAAKRIEFLCCSEKKKNARLRISVSSGGCSGFQYNYDMISSNPEIDDILVIAGNAEIIIDSASMEFLKGSKIDYVKTLVSENFEISNPNAASGCGCGNSFSL